MGLTRAESTRSTQKLHKWRGEHLCKGKPCRKCYTNPAYWDARLKRMGVTMDTGWNPDWLSYGHDEMSTDKNGRVIFVPPDGESLEDE